MCSSATLLATRSPAPLPANHARAGRYFLAFRLSARKASVPLRTSTISTSPSVPAKSRSITDTETRSWVIIANVFSGVSVPSASVRNWMPWRFGYAIRPASLKMMRTVRDCSRMLRRLAAHRSDGGSRVKRYIGRLAMRTTEAIAIQLLVCPCSADLRHRRGKTPNVGYLGFTAKSGRPQSGQITPFELRTVAWRLSREGLSAFVLQPRESELCRINRQVVD